MSEATTKAIDRAELILAGTPSFAEDEETQLADLLADLRHWAASKDVDFDSALDRSEVYVEEDAETPAPTPETICEWFHACGRVAVKSLPHPLLGEVPTCQRCADKVEGLSK